ncbi:MAG: peptidase C11 [Clostridia bacterium]|nr:peptidase C11 [Clostridia bacterium]
MNNTPNSGGRKKKVTQGSGKVGKGEQVQTHGPVGRQDGYQGRKEGNKPPQNPNNGSEDDRGLAGDIIGSLLTGGGNSGNSGGGDLLGSLLGGSSGNSGNSGNSGSSGSGLFGSSSGGNSGNSGGGLFGSSSGGSSGSPGKKGGLSKIIIIIVALAALYFIYRSCSGGGCSLGNITGGGGDFSGGSTNFMSTIEQGFNQYSEADLNAPTAISASTSTSQQQVQNAINASVNNVVSNNARPKYTKLKGNGQDTTTLMVYMCGTDLESKYGMATNDLNEMLHATLNDDKLNIIVETGGTKLWKNSVMTPGTNQLWRVRKGGIEALNKDMGRMAMTKASTLSSFIQFCSKNYPADRYMLIMWDHGGGSLSGYGYDQYFSGTMTLDQINKALKDGGVKFDFIGFDACLMGTMETAVVAEQYADYLIGSEETEPGCGWYYTNWLTKLSQNPSASTVELGKIIIDDFNDVCRQNNAGDTTTLSIVDLAEFAGTVPEAFSSFASNISTLLDGSNYQVVANARSGAREFGAGTGIDHVDLIHLASRIGTPEANNLVSVLNSCIKYNRTSRSMANSYGMSIYFPYKSFKSVNSAVSLYNAIGMDGRYSAAVKSFASLAAGGQIATGSTSSPVGSLFGDLSGSGASSGDLLGSLLGGGGGSSSGIDMGSLLSSILGGRSLSDPENAWFESDRVLQNLDYYDDHAIYPEDMHLTDKNGGRVLHMDQSKWDMVESVRLNVFYDDGTGYIDLGMDNVYEFDGDGDLMIDYDRTWIALDGQIVPYYIVNESIDGDHYAYIGRVPALVNGELADIMICFDDEKPENEYGYVTGVRYIYANNETDTTARGLAELKKGDKIRFLCDYYSYDQEYQASYTFGDEFIVDGEIEVSNIEIDGGKCLVTYCLTDMYANEFWTEAAEY